MEVKKITKKYGGKYISNYDVEYVTNFSLLLDLNILLKTVLVVIFGEEKFKK